MRIKKYKLALVFTLCITFCLQAQNPFELLNANNISAGFNAAGDLFWNYQSPQFEVPKGQKVHSIFAGSTWIGGLDDNNQLHLAANTYRQGGTDYWAGPIANTYNTPYDNKYNRVWKINKKQIQNHQLNFAQPNYVMPEVIANWPGNGNTNNGEAPLLAPYADVNQNSVYDPAQGDYPIIRGDYAVYCIYNDARDIHTESGGEIMGIEVHMMAYTYDMFENADFDNTIFLNYQVYNRSSNKYKKVYITNWVDFDLGNAFDDYIGSDSTLNTFYIYNSDNFDEAVNQNGNFSQGYGSGPPAVGYVALSTPMSAFVVYDNDQSERGNPSSAVDYYNYMRAYWLDGQKITYGGNGKGGGMGATKKPINYMYTGVPSKSNSWSETQAGNPPGDRRGLGSVGPFVLAAGGKECIDLAFIFAQDSTNIKSVDLLKARTKPIHDFYASQTYQCDSIKVAGAKNADFKAAKTFACKELNTDFSDLSDTTALAWEWVFEGASPNISNDQNPKNIYYPSVGNYGVTLTVSYTNGLVVSAKKENYISIKDNSFTPSLSISADLSKKICEGSSLFLSASTNTSASGIVWYMLRNGVKTIVSSSSNTLYYAFVNGDQVYAEIQATDVCSGTTQNYSSNVITVNNVVTAPIAPIIFYNKASNVLACNQSANTYKWYKDGLGIPAAFSANYQPTSSGFYSVKITDVYGCSAVSNQLYVDLKGGTGNGMSESKDQLFKIFPHPNTGNFSIQHGNNLQISAISIFDPVGKLIYTQVLLPSQAANNVNIELKNTPAGFYIVQLNTNKGLLNSRLIIQ